MFDEKNNTFPPIAELSCVAEIAPAPSSLLLAVQSLFFPPAVPELYTTMLPNSPAVPSRKRRIAAAVSSVDTEPTTWSMCPMNVAL